MAYSEGKNGDESTEITTHNSLEESEGPLTPQHSLSPVITAFLEFSYSNELANTANDFINDHAEAHGFERVKELEASGEGHPLIWFDIYSQYCDAIDSELQEFCSIQGIIANDLFEQLEFSLSSSETLVDALPGFVKLCSYHHFCDQMEAQATLAQVRYNAAELAVSNTNTNPDRPDYFSGEWKGLYNFKSAERDQYFKELCIPWVLRKLLKNLLSKEGKVSGVVRLNCGEDDAFFLRRTFSFGMLGKQDEIFQLRGGDYIDFNGGMGKKHLKCLAVMSENGRNITVKTRRFADNTKTVQYRPSNYRDNRGFYEIVQTWNVSEDGNSMLCRDSLYYPLTGEMTKGWGYSMIRV